MVMTGLFQPYDSPAPESANNRQTHGEDTPLAHLRLDDQPAAMAVEDVVHDGQPQPGAAQIAAARRVDPIESLGQARQVIARNTLAMVAYRDFQPVLVPAAEMDFDRRIRPAIFDRVVDQVLENLQQLIAGAADR